MQSFAYLNKNVFKYFVILSDIYIYYIATRHLTEVLKILSKKFLMGFSKHFNECSSTIFLANFILIGAEFKF